MWLLSEALASPGGLVRAPGALPPAQPGGAVGSQRTPRVPGGRPRRRLRGEPDRPGRGRRPPCRLDQPVNPAVRLRLEYAEKLLGSAGAAMGCWPRCAAWLIRLALEHALNGLWARRYPELVDANKR